MSTNKPRVYLAGPVAGLTWEEAMGWRRAIAVELQLAGLEPVLPCEAEEVLAGRGPLSAMGEDVPGCTGEEIFERDVALLDTCDAVLVNLAGAKQYSLGTVWEMGFANASGKPIVIVMGPEDIHQHCFVVCSGVVVESFAEAIAQLKEVSCV